MQMLHQLPFVALTVLAYLTLAVLAVAIGVLINLISGRMEFPAWMQVPWKLAAAAVFLGVVSLAVSGL